MVTTEAMKHWCQFEEVDSSGLPSLAYHLSLLLLESVDLQHSFFIKPPFLHLYIYTCKHLVYDHLFVFNPVLIMVHLSLSSLHLNLCSLVTAFAANSGLSSG